MLNNSANINKMNNGLSPKESLNSDSQQFYQYQQNEQWQTFFRWEAIVHFVDIGRIVEHHSLNFL
jgi:plasmid maintenance system killer protein